MKKQLVSIFFALLLNNVSKSMNDDSALLIPIITAMNGLKGSSKPNSDKIQPPSQETSSYNMTEKKELTHAERERKRQEAKYLYDLEIQQLQASGATACNIFYELATEEYYRRLRDLGYNLDDLK